MIAKRPSSERALFFSLWLIFILLFGIYKFRPRELATAMPEPPLHVSEELTGMLGAHRYVRVAPSAFELEFKVPYEYRARLDGDAKTLHLGYQLVGEGRVLSKGVTTCVIKPEHSIASVSLKNSDRVNPKSIQIFLAH